MYNRISSITSCLLWDRLKWFKDLIDTIGIKFILTIIFTQHILKGFILRWVSIPMMYLYSSLGVDAVTMQRHITIISIPFIMKPILGVISDLIPICGYHKLPYMTIALFMGTIASALIPFLWSYNIFLLTFLLFIIFVQLAVIDLLIEAKYVEKQNEFKEKASDIQTFVIMGRSIGTFISIATIGIILSYLDTQWIYMICVPFMIINFIPIIFNWVDDRKNNNYNDDNVAITIKKKVPFKLGVMAVVLTILASIIIIVVVLDLSSSIIMLLIFITAVILILSLYFTTDQPVFRVAVFFFISGISSISLESSIFYFYTDDVSQYPEGPHFSKFFYTTTIGICETVFNLIGIAIYNKYMTKWSYKKIFTLSAIIITIIGITRTIIFLRWNVTVFGIPDTIFVLLIESFSHTVNAWSIIPSMVLLGKLCPKNTEATVFAILVGTLNMSGAISSYQGVFLMDTIGLTPRGEYRETGKFEYLWLAHIFVTILSIIPVLCFMKSLIPEGSTVDSIIVINDDDDEYNENRTDKDDADDGDIVFLNSFGASSTSSSLSENSSSSSSSEYD